MAGVPEVGESIRFEISVAYLPRDSEGALVVGGGFGEVAQLVFGVAQAVPGMSLEPAIADFCVEGEGLPAEGAGLLVVAEVGVAPSRRC